MDFLLGLEGLGSLHIGNSHDARSEELLKENGITAVVNVARDLNDPYHPGIKYYKAGLEDGNNNHYNDYVLACYTVLSLVMDKPFHKVLLHCHEGRSRTAAVGACVVAFLDGLEKGFDPQATWKESIAGLLKDASEKVCAARPLCEKMNEEHMENMPEALFQLFIRFAKDKSGEPLIK